MSGIAAWSGIASMKRAAWDSANGYTVQFNLPEPEGEDKSNPFRRFTKMRKNRVGTRFHATIVSMDEQSVYDDEAMLKGWSDSNTGQVVAFWLANVAGGEHPFSGFSDGAEFALALVELSDDNEAIDQVKRERVEAALKPRHKQRLSEGAAMMCANPIFWDWAGVGSRDRAADFMRDKIGIQSRRELDTDAQAAQRFHDVVRLPFLSWQRERGYIDRHH